MTRAFLPVAAWLIAGAAPALAQGIDLSHGGPIEITSSQGMEWRQEQQEVIARGDARAVRGDVTVTADELLAFYRKKSTPAGQDASAQGAAQGAAQAASKPAPSVGIDTGNNEIYRLEAIGHVNIYTPTDHATADKAVYDIDQAVLVLTGHDLKITTPQQILTARDVIEWWSQKHMGVGRGQATVVTNDGRRVYGDTLVAYTRPTDKAEDQKAGSKPAVQQAASKPGADPLAGSGKLQKADAFGNVEVRTQTEVIRGDRGTYDADTDMARIVGHVSITRGLNQLNGDEALVNLKTGVSTLTRVPGQRVKGLVVPNDTSTQKSGAPPEPPAKKP